MKVFSISDIHADFDENWSWLKHLPNYYYKNDILVVAGDIAHDLLTIQNTFYLLKTKFKTIFYTPGNHELWVTNGEKDSIVKFLKILDICENLNIKTNPEHIDNTWIVPLYSWYNFNFDKFNYDDNLGLDRWSDFYLCHWPSGIGELDRFFYNLNKKYIQNYVGNVISFSHFLPRLDLLPPSNYLTFKGLPKVAGSSLLEKQVRALGSKLHIFGHSHINFDIQIDGIRYVQNALSYPRERNPVFTPSLKQVWDTRINC